MIGKRLFLVAVFLAGCGAGKRNEKAPAAPTVTAADDAPPRFAELGSCVLESGERIEDCRIAYRTLGTLDATKSNVIVVPTWFTGTTKGLVGMIPGFVDTKRFYVVLVDSLGNGVSSSPSNSKRQPRLAFPKFTVHDMVESQKRFLEEVLGVHHVRVVMGLSMGGMQAFDWAVSHPEFMDAFVSIVGTPQLASNDLLLWTTELHALESDVAYRNGDYEGMPVLRAVHDIHQLALTTPSYRSKETSRDGFAKWLATEEADASFDWNDRRRQLEAMLAHDVARGTTLSVAASKVKAKALVVVSERDQMVAPEPSKTFAKLLSAQLVVLDTPCGHLALGCEGAKAADAVKSFLSTLGR
ncbi:Homoserine O-acetyltransferase [Labilithrix luteola]|uniref:Homoserine O-acetyltransferase n=1 Tax=Labilithrix luteola TaxID=1391654 RepID=A0A0K1Q4J9_9BACT|nr:alpha/beta fold hydrolase [Labilithrix luteola]AKV00736.1 Homoserine O-acetyltransferase [Labilithrix luteola]